MRSMPVTGLLLCGLLFAIGALPARAAGDTIRDMEKKGWTLSFHDEFDGAKLESNGGSYKGPDFSADFHIFAVDWQPNEIVWYVDGTERFRSNKGIPAMPMYVIANLAVGGDWPGNPDATTRFPGYMDIDYIR